MTREEAIKILHPETSREALLPYAYDQARRLAMVTEAMRMGAEALVKNQALRNAANDADLRCEALEKKLAEAIEDMSGICYLCEKSKPFKMGDWVMRSCDYMAAKAASNMPRCVHFVWKGQEEKHGTTNLSN